jgi:hypothetical protein
LTIYNNMQENKTQDGIKSNAKIMKETKIRKHYRASDHGFYGPYFSTVLFIDVSELYCLWEVSNYKVETSE